MKKTESFPCDLAFQDLCSKPGSTNFFFRKCEIVVFNESTDNSIMESLLWMIFYELCWNKSWKTNTIYYLNQIIPEMEIFRDKLSRYFWFWVYFLLYCDRRLCSPCIKDSERVCVPRCKSLPNVNKPSNSSISTPTAGTFSKSLRQSSEFILYIFGNETLQNV